MKVVIYNIQYGLGKDNRYDLARIAREIEDADVIALQGVGTCGGANVNGPHRCGPHLFWRVVQYAD